MVLNSNEWFGGDKHKPSKGLRHEYIAVYFGLKSLLSVFTGTQNAPTQLLLGMDHYFLTAGGWGGEVANFEINCLQRL